MVGELTSLIPGSLPRNLARAALVASVLILALAVDAGTAQAAPCDAPIENEIVCENSKPGSPASEWDVAGAGSSNIQGYATDISVDQGGTVHFKVDTDSDDYRLDIYRIGYYGGDGARQVATIEPSASLPQAQPACLNDLTTGLVDCGNWAESASWAAPADAVSGIYFAKLVREDGTAGSSHVIFIVRDDDGGSDLLFQTSDTTWQATAAALADTWQAGLIEPKDSEGGYGYECPARYKGGLDVRGPEEDGSMLSSHRQGASRVSSGRSPGTGVREAGAAGPTAVPRQQGAAWHWAGYGQTKRKLGSCAGPGLR